MRLVSTAEQEAFANVQKTLSATDNPQQTLDVDQQVSIPTAPFRKTITGTGIERQATAGQYEILSSKCPSNFNPASDRPFLLDHLLYISNRIHLTLKSSSLRSSVSSPFINRDHRYGSSILCIRPQLNPRLAGLCCFATLCNHQNNDRHIRSPCQVSLIISSPLKSFTSISSSNASMSLSHFHIPWITACLVLPFTTTAQTDMIQPVSSTTTTLTLDVLLSAITAISNASNIEVEIPSVTIAAETSPTPVLGDDTFILIGCFNEPPAISSTRALGATGSYLTPTFATQDSLTVPLCLDTCGVALAPNTSGPYIYAAVENSRYVRASYPFPNECIADHVLQRMLLWSDPLATV